MYISYILPTVCLALGAREGGIQFTKRVAKNKKMEIIPHVRHHMMSV